MGFVLTARELVRLIHQMGFVEVRQTGSHRQFRHPDGRCVTVPFHGSKDMRTSLLVQIVRTLKMSLADLKRIART